MPDSQLQQQLTDLQLAFDNERSNKQRSPKVEQQLRAFKLNLAKAGLLFGDETADTQDLVTARSGLEIGALYSLRVHDVQEFERYYASLQVFYRDLAHVLPPSHSYHPILGLELLALLSTGRLTEFHTLLESLDPAVLRDEFVSWPIDLERWLMEGAYNKVYHARERLPREEYEVLIVTLLTTVRRQIADTVEASYPSLPLANTATLLFFKQGETDQLMAYAKERGWTLNPSTSTFTFERSRPETIAAAAGIRPGDALHNLIEPALRLAHQLEAIV